MENLQKKPAKGILKTSSSFDQQEQQKAHSDIKWDEMNILQTLHPPGKDYGLMKIEEPKTPYSYYKDNESASDNEGATASQIIDSLCDSINKSPKILIPHESLEEEEEEENEDEELTEEELKKKREFEIKRKMHYNEYQAVKLARKLLEEEDDDDDENDEKKDENLKEDEDDDDIEVEEPEETGVQETQ
ncbi:hypothetical protein B4U80_01383 [Leptotrombidium deliense]|uniref:Protein phosphatase inhibitor 2-like protein n=1 Tax=Leptotrombidium deliense TaxID=299467 RepID=A0A443SEU8_9ACAR|nr:hypothetical protein B4U80_01383 [Leptotrombidium deliense]